MSQVFWNVTPCHWKVGSQYLKGAQHLHFHSKPVPATSPALTTLEDKGDTHSPSQHLNSLPSNTMWQPSRPESSSTPMWGLQISEPGSIRNFQFMADVSSKSVGRNAHACPLQCCLQFRDTGQLWHSTNGLLLIARTCFKWLKLEPCEFPNQT